MIYKLAFLLIIINILIKKIRFILSIIIKLNFQIMQLIRIYFFNIFYICLFKKNFIHIIYIIFFMLIIKSIIFL